MLLRRQFFYVYSACGIDPGMIQLTPYTLHSSDFVFEGFPIFQLSWRVLFAGSYLYLRLLDFFRKLPSLGHFGIFRQATRARLIRQSSIITVPFSE